MTPSDSMLGLPLAEVQAAVRVLGSVVGGSLEGGSGEQESAPLQSSVHSWLAHLAGGQQRKLDTTSNSRHHRAIEN